MSWYQPGTNQLVIFLKTQHGRVSCHRLALGTRNLTKALSRGHICESLLISIFHSPLLCDISRFQSLCPYYLPGTYVSSRLRVESCRAEALGQQPSTGLVCVEPRVPILVVSLGYSLVISRQICTEVRYFLLLLHITPILFVHDHQMGLFKLSHNVLY